MHPDTLNLVAKVTRTKSAAHDRFQCREVYQLWDSGQVTVDHFIEDEEWGGMEESRETVDTTHYPRDFFKAGFNRVINYTGAKHEEPL